MGDKINVGGNVTGSAIGRGASVTAEQIIANINQSVERSADSDLVAAVKKALEALTNAKLPERDAKEAAQTVNDIREEAERPKAEADDGRPNRLARWLDSLTKICKPAADAIAAAKVVIAALSK
jgi:hypothetical protein